MCVNTSVDSSLYYLRLDGTLLHEIEVLILWRRWPSYSLEIWGTTIRKIRNDENPSLLLPPHHVTRFSIRIVNHTQMHIFWQLQQTSGPSRTDAIPREFLSLRPRWRGTRLCQNEQPPTTNGYGGVTCTFRYCGNELATDYRAFLVVGQGVGFDIVPGTERGETCRAKNVDEICDYSSFANQSKAARANLLALMDFQRRHNVRADWEVRFAKTSNQSAEITSLSRGQSARCNKTVSCNALKACCQRYRY